MCANFAQFVPPCVESPSMIGRNNNDTNTMKGYMMLGPKLALDDIAPITKKEEEKIKSRL